MAKFFVGQRVKLVSATTLSNVGSQGVITHLGSWRPGDRLPIGEVIDDGYWPDVIVQWDGYVSYGGVRIDQGPSNTSRLEPILPEGAQPSEFSFTELMDNLGVVVA